LRCACIRESNPPNPRACTGLSTAQQFLNLAHGAFHIFLYDAFTTHHLAQRLADPITYAPHHVCALLPGETKVGANHCVLHTIDYMAAKDFVLLQLAALREVGVY
jgi:hypothetical protein